MLKRFLVKIHWILSSQFGLDPLIIVKSFRGLPRFIKEWFEFRKNYLGPMNLMPCLNDWYAEGGTTKNEYFWQDLLVARWIFEAKPQRHVDVGSRVDGFVAHVASFRDIEVFDVRPINTQIPGIVFKQADLMCIDGLPSSVNGYCDSLSCLHAIEHFGLGRYGDPIDPIGYERGIANMALLLKPGGKFYLSTPIGRERVEFNANRVFNPSSLILFAKCHGLRLQKLTVIDNSGEPREVQVNPETMHVLAESNYNLGIFVFIKT
jgi:hypothetical protein